MIKSFKDLNIWQKAHRLVLDIYQLTNKFPKEEKFGLVSQIRRAAVSVVANIAEGFRKRSNKEKVNFYTYSQSSLDEVEYYIILCRDLNFITEDEKQKIDKEIQEIASMLGGLIKIIKNKKST
ncbi:MAG: four helix bundle protein [Elusimicrobiota bacterium]|nr:four helix bundle protein [Elusimicrobiota bacterium]